MVPRTLPALLLALMCAAVVLQERASAQSVETTRVPNPTLSALRQDLLMSEVLTIIRESRDRSSSKIYLRSRSHRLDFIATQQQEPMVLDGYAVLDLASPIMGYSLFYYGSTGPLVIADAAVNPTQGTAMSGVQTLIHNALDSIRTPDGAKLYFLGVYDLDASQVINIMIREGPTPTGSDYAIRYAISDR